MIEDLEDTSGRPWAKVADIKKDDHVWTDGDFTCCGKHRKKLIEKDGDGLFFRCRAGKHYLDGQSDYGIVYVGLYPNDPKNSANP